MDPPGFAPGFSACGAGVFLLDDEPVLSPEVHVGDLPARHAPKDLNPDQLGWNQPCCQLHQGRVLCCRTAEAVGLEPTTAKPRPVFKTGSSSGRMTSVSFVEPSCGGWNRNNIKTFRASRPTVERPRIGFYF